MAFKSLKLQLLHLDRELHHLDFLKLARDIGVIPKFLSSRSKFLSSNFMAAKHKFEMGCLKSIIRQKFAVVNSISRSIYGVRNDNLYHKLSSELSAEDFDDAFRKISVFREVQNNQLQKTLEKKIAYLAENSGSFGCKEPSIDFLNLSKVHFDEYETRVLRRGPKYVCNVSPSVKDIIPHFENVVASVPSNSKEEVRNRIFMLYKDYLKKNLSAPSNEIRFLKNLRANQDIAVISTDKSCRLAILDKDDYINRMTQTISDMDCTIITDDPLPKFTRAVERLVKYKTWPESMKPFIKHNSLASIPAIFGVLKDHKQGFPMRPIVAKQTSPSYFLEKAFVHFLKEILPPSHRTVRSTKDFITKLETITLPTNFIMATMDIKSLYPSIDVHRAKDAIANIMATIPTLSQPVKSTILSGLNLILDNNFFKFNNTVYKQMNGAPMGSPISGLLAEYILRPMEEEYITRSSIQPIAWFRFVDDIFILWPSTSDSLKTFCTNINNMDPKIQYTAEYERDSSVAFLDVSLKNIGGAISRSVFRKAVNSRATIPNSASAPRNYKFATFRTHIRRAITVCTPDNIHAELNTIRDIAKLNGYCEADINSLIATIMRQHPSTPLANDPWKRVALPYLPGLHERLSGYLRKYGVQLIAKTFPKIKDYLKVKIDPVPSDCIPGIYEIPYSLPTGETNYYIGMTMRKFSIRLAEHMADIRHGRHKTALSRFYLDNTAITIKFNEAKILVSFQDSRIARVRESIEIYTRRDSICNEQDSLSIPSLWKCLL